ncbi:MAG TPA: type II toxin-antitoxin system Phd/YefM family antitoxin [Candidatus Acidoferrum sp.]
MKQASVRDLRRRFSAVQKLLRAGGEVQITRRGRVIARLLPPEPQVPDPKVPNPRAAVEMPDFLGRIEKVFGKRRLKVSGAALLALDRERF